MTSENGVGNRSLEKRRFSSAILRLFSVHSHCQLTALEYRFFFYLSSHCFGLTFVLHLGTTTRTLFFSFTFFPLWGCSSVCVSRPEIFFFSSPAAAQIRLTHFRTTGLSNTKLSTHEKKIVQSIALARSFLLHSHSCTLHAVFICSLRRAVDRGALLSNERATQFSLSLHFLCFPFQTLLYDRPAGGRATELSFWMRA